MSATACVIPFNDESAMQKKRKVRAFDQETCTICAVSRNMSIKSYLLLQQWLYYSLVIEVRIKQMEKRASVYQETCTVCTGLRNPCVTHCHVSNSSNVTDFYSSDAPLIHYTLVLNPKP